MDSEYGRTLGLELRAGTPPAAGALAVNTVHIPPAATARAMATPATHRATVSPREPCAVVHNLVDLNDSQSFSEKIITRPLMTVHVFRDFSKLSINLT